MRNALTNCKSSTFKDTELDPKDQLLTDMIIEFKLHELAKLIRDWILEEVGEFTVDMSFKVRNALIIAINTPFVVSDSSG